MGLFLDSLKDKCKMMKSPLIQIFVHQRCSMIFSPEDAVAVREKYRIVGSLIGCHPKKPLQNVQMGMPLQLLPEEVTLLKEKNLADVYERGLPLPPTDEENNRHEQSMKALFEQQEELYAKCQMMDFERLKEVIKKGKRAKKKLLNKTSSIDGNTRDEQDTEQDEAMLKPLHRLSAYTQIPSVALRDMNLEAAEWIFPETEDESVRYATYREFWERGFFLTSGTKFGGDFLVYPDDPNRCHSFYIAVCIPYEKKLSMIDFISLGRLSVTVKKTIVLCSLNKNGKVCFTSLNWSHVS